MNFSVNQGRTEKVVRAVQDSGMGEKKTFLVKSLTKIPQGGP